MSDLLKQLCDRYGLKESNGGVVLDYLNQFGHINSEDTDIVGSAISRFQTRMSLPATGELDRTTLREMLQPRCGLPDHAMMSSESRWNRNHLTYTVYSYVTGISQSDQDDLIHLGFKQWSDVADVSFQRIDNREQANIVIGAGKGRANGFDGPFGTLAWANLPQGNDAQLQLMFDMDESWVKSLSQGQKAILFLNVMCHEAGHILGLDHTSTRGALMYPTYDSSVSRPQQQDDISRIQNIYGKPGNRSPSPAPRESVSEIWLRGVSGNWITGYKVSEQLY